MQRFGAQSQFIASAGIIPGKPGDTVPNGSTAPLSNSKVGARNPDFRAMHNCVLSPFVVIRFILRCADTPVSIKCLPDWQVCDYTGSANCAHDIFRVRNCPFAKLMSIVSSCR
jgi:hypothetical protein